MNERLLSGQKLLASLVIVSCLHLILCKTIADSNQINTKALPKIITLQTYKDWSSRLGANQSTPQSAALIFEESKEVITTDYGDKQRSSSSLVTTTTGPLSATTTQSSVTKVQNKTTDQNKPVNAHNVAAQVLSRIIHITPLLALASNGVPHRHSDFNRTTFEPKKPNEDIVKSESMNSLNEIDIDSNVTPYKTERITPSVISFPITPSVISFPTTPPTTTLSELTMPMPDSTPTEQPEYTDEDHNHEHDHHDDEEVPPSEDQDDYDDDDEEESYRYPVKVSFDDIPEGPPSERESSAPFVMPNIDLNPESLKQKGCRTVVKEVQAIPLENGQPMAQSSPNNRNEVTPINGLVRSKRDADGNSRKFTSIVMTKECHYPGDEGASSEEVPQTVPSTLLPSIAATMSDSKREVTYQTPTPPNYDDYDEDFAGLDFRPRLRYSSSDLEDMMEPKSSEDRRSYADSPSFGKDSSKYIPPKDDFGFDDPVFHDFGEGFYNKNNRRKKQKKMNKNKSAQSSSQFDFDDEDFGPQPKSSRTKSRGSKPAVYRSNRPRILNNDKGRVKKGGEGKRKPKKVNRSFAFFRTAEPKEKIPNENDYSVSYGTGNFQSFSDSYDSDKDGPRKKGKKMLRDDDDDD